MNRRFYLFARFFGSAWLAVSFLTCAVPCSGAEPPLLPALEESWDEGVDDRVEYQPVLSAPAWVVPSGALPPGVTVQPSNNNLAVAVHEGRLFLAWRTAPHHFASGDARLYVISSPDGRTWSFESSIALRRDVREPFLLVVGNRLFLYFAELGDKPYAFEPRALWRTERLGTGRWTDRARWGGQREMAWEFKVRRGRAWMTSYRGKHYGAGRSVVSVLFRWSADGERWHDARTPDPVVYRGGVSEVAFEFDATGRLWAVTRNEDGDESGFGSHLVTAPPGKPGDWQFPRRSDPRRYDSPRMFRHGRDVYLVARRDVGAVFDAGWRFLPTSVRKLALWPAYSLRPKRTTLYRLDPARRALEPIMDLPSAGDTAFPSIARLGPHTFLIANYSSPLDDPGMSWFAGQVSRRGTGIYVVMLHFTPKPGQTIADAATSARVRPTLAHVSATGRSN